VYTKKGGKSLDFSKDHETSWWPRENVLMGGGGAGEGKRDVMNDLPRKAESEKTVSVIGSK